MEVKLDESIKAACARYNVLLALIEGKAKAASSWTASDIKQKTEELQKDTTELESFGQRLSKTLAERKEAASLASDQKKQG